MLRHTFALNTREGGRNFLLNMYNYGAEMARFTQGFSATSFEGLKSMMAMGGKLRSWTDQSRRSRSGSNNRSRKMHTVQEEDQEEPTDDSCLALLPEEVMADLGLKNDVFVLPDVSMQFPLSFTTRNILTNSTEPLRSEGLAT